MRWIFFIEKHPKYVCIHSSELWIKFIFVTLNRGKRVYNKKNNNKLNPKYSVVNNLDKWSRWHFSYILSFLDTEIIAIDITFISVGNMNSLYLYVCLVFKKKCFKILLIIFKQYVRISSVFHPYERECLNIYRQLVWFVRISVYFFSIIFTYVISLNEICS